MKYSTDKDTNRFVRKLLREGWSFRRGGKHGKLAAPAKKGFLTIPSSPSDVRTLRNLQSDAQRLVSTRNIARTSDGSKSR